MNAPRARAKPKRPPGLAEAPARFLPRGVNPPATLPSAPTPATVARVDLNRTPPEARLARSERLADYLRLGYVPFRRQGDFCILAIADPADLPAIRNLEGGAILWARADRDAIEGAIIARFGAALAAHALDAPPARFALSLGGAHRLFFVLFLLVLIAVAAWHPAATVTIAVATGAFFVFSNLGLRLIALSALRRHRKAPPPPPASVQPPVSLLVPLYREARILPDLVAGLRKLDYVADRVQCVFVLEEADQETRIALAGLDMPTHWRVVISPQAPIRTKPRALNYALPFATGEIIGILDAEDRPAAGQLRDVAAWFAAHPQTACIQGVLDYHNTGHNLVSRWFTIEYAIWFRLILPGIAALGLPVPLGGTTCYLRRAALDRSGGWDARNVTEDADLGLRLHRLGLRVDVVTTVTDEEAAFRPRAWIRQRSRWLKGYAMTWAVHMRAPVRLWRDHGPAGFLAVQVMLLGTIVTFALAPVLWSLWLLFFGLPHPIAETAWGYAIYPIAAGFLLAEVVQITLGFAAMASPRHRPYRWWVLTMQLYWPLATIAVYKALAEIALSPYYWDKTEHAVGPAGD